MTARTWWRIAAGLTLFFALAHTGGMLLPMRQGPEENALLDHMRSYRFDIMGANRTYWDFYFGFGLYLTVSLLVLAALSWQVGTLSAMQPAARPLGWTLLTGQVAFAALSWIYFFVAPAAVSSLAAVCTLVAQLVGEKSSVRESAQHR